MDDDGFSRAPGSSSYSLQEEVLESPSTTAAAKDSDPLLALLEQATTSPETKTPAKQSPEKRFHHNRIQLEINTKYTRIL